MRVVAVYWVGVLPDMAHAVFSLLQFDDLLVAAVVSKGFLAVSTSPTLWLTLFIRDFSTV